MRERENRYMRGGVRDKDGESKSERERESESERENERVFRFVVFLGICGSE